MRACFSFLASEEGTTAVEYAVMLGLIIMTCVLTVRALGDQAGGIWASNQTKLDDAGF